MNINKLLKLTIALFALSQAIAARSQSGEIGADGTQVLSQETVRSKDENGNVVEKRITKKIRARTVVDFEEASIEGKVKKPNAAYLLHGADLDFKHLYQIKQNQRNRIMGSFEYLR